MIRIEPIYVYVDTVSEFLVCSKTYVFGEKTILFNDKKLGLIPEASKTNLSDNASSNSKTQHLGVSGNLNIQALKE